MNEADFRRLCVLALDDRLDDASRRQWELLRLSNPEFAAHYDELAIARRRLSNRLSSARVVPAQARPEVSNRMFWVLAPLVGALSALAGGLGMDSWVRHERGAKSRAEHHMVAANDASRAPAAATPAPLEPLVPPSNGTAVPALSDRPPTNPENQQPAKPDGSEPWFRLLPATGAEVRLLRPGTTEYADAPGGADLWGGAVVRVTRGEAVIRADEGQFLLSGRGELEVLGPRRLRLLRGRLLVRVLAEGFVLDCDETSLRLSTGDYRCTSQRGLSELAVLAGRVEASRDSARATVGRNTLLDLSRDLRETAIVGDALVAMRVDLAAMAHRTLYWNFEDGPGDCNEGAVVGSGLDGGKALRHDPARPGVGTTRFEPLFSAVPGLRLRAWVLTDAASVEITARVHLPHGLRQVGLRVPLTPGTGWQMIDVPLAGLAGGPKRLQPGWIAGAGYSGLQFHVPAQGDAPLTPFALTIDEVEIYTLR
ncbi:MAG: hypothetical protein KF754_10140 [Planctomycetes bacterium]|nr:hypothetical protein [Planctomycetota bacterium]